MKMKDMERQLLLRASGELSPRQEQKLKEVLAKNPEARAFEEWRLTIMEKARTSDAAANPNRSATASIMLAARKQSESHRHRLQREVFRVSWHPAVYSAAAAIILLVSATLVFNSIRNPSADMMAQSISLLKETDLDEQLDSLDQIVTSTLLEFADSMDDYRDVNSLANELIKMENMQI